MHVAKAAQYCEAYFTSIMYAELWALQIEATQSQYTFAEIKSEVNLQEVMKKVSPTNDDHTHHKLVEFIDFHLLSPHRPTFPLVTWMPFRHS